MEEEERVNYGTYTFSAGFKGAGSDSLWFIPTGWGGGLIGEPLFSNAMEAKERASSMLAFGCMLAERWEPQLAEALRQLAKAPASLDFFEYGASSQAGLGWMRLSFEARFENAKEAIAACEGALGACGAPLACARAQGSFGEFASGESDQVPSGMAMAADSACRQLNENHAAMAAELQPAEMLSLESLGGQRMLFCFPSGEHQGKLATLNCYAKFIQAGLEARKASGPESAGFFDRLDWSLGAAADSPLPNRAPIERPRGLFSPAPQSLHASRADGFPDEGFKEGARHLARELSKRFGPLAAKEGVDMPASSQDWAACSGLFSKLKPVVDIPRAPSENEASEASRKTRPI